MTLTKTSPLPRPHVSTFGHPYGSRVVGVAESSAVYADQRHPVDGFVSCVVNLYHFVDGIVQSCRTTTYRTPHRSVAAGRVDALRCVDTWQRPFRPERGDFAQSLRSCHRRYASTDQIHLTTRVKGEGPTTSQKTAPISARVKEEGAQTDPQLTLALPTLEPVPGYRKY